MLQAKGTRAAVLNPPVFLFYLCPYSSSVNMLPLGRSRSAVFDVGAVKGTMKRKGLSAGCCATPDSVEP